jgi:hypothetical protein
MRNREIKGRVAGVKLPKSASFASPTKRQFAPQVVEVCSMIWGQIVDAVRLEFNIIHDNLTQPPCRFGFGEAGGRVIEVDGSGHWRVKRSGGFTGRSGKSEKSHLWRNQLPYYRATGLWDSTPEVGFWTPTTLPGQLRAGENTIRISPSAVLTGYPGY